MNNKNYDLKSPIELKKLDRPTYLKFNSLHLPHYGGILKSKGTIYSETF